MNRCADCKYFSPGFGASVGACYRPELTEVSPVYGDRIAADPYAQRRATGGCGPEGKYFLARPPVTPEPPKRSLWARLMRRSKEWA